MWYNGFFFSNDYITTMKSMGKVYELMLIDVDDDQEVNEKVAKRIMTKAVFIWLSVVNKPVCQEDNTTLITDLLKFLVLPNDSCPFIQSFCENLRYLESREKMVAMVNPLAVKVLRETRRLKKISSDLPLAIALLTDEVS